MEVYGSMGADNDKIRGMQIKSLIDEKNEQIKEIMTPNFYSLNNNVLEILNEVRELQKQCPHEYDEDGFCIYCYHMGGFC